MMTKKQKQVTLDELIKTSEILEGIKALKTALQIYERTPKVSENSYIFFLEVSLLKEKIVSLEYTLADLMKLSTSLEMLR